METRNEQIIRTRPVLWDLSDMSYTFLSDEHQVRVVGVGAGKQVGWQPGRPKRGLL